MSNAVLELQGVGAELPYQGGWAPVLRDVSFSIAEGEIVGTRWGIGIREVDDGENGREVTPEGQQALREGARRRDGGSAEWPRAS